jgi:hypothetical protein
MLADPGGGAVATRSCQVISYLIPVQPRMQANIARTITPTTTMMTGSQLGVTKALLRNTARRRVTGRSASAPQMWKPLIRLTTNRR